MLTPSQDQCIVCKWGWCFSQPQRSKILQLWITISAPALSWVCKESFKHEENKEFKHPNNLQGLAHVWLKCGSPVTHHLNFKWSIKGYIKCWFFVVCTINYVTSEMKCCWYSYMCKNGTDNEKEWLIFLIKIESSIMIGPSIWQSSLLKYEFAWKSASHFQLFIYIGYRMPKRYISLYYTWASVIKLN